MILEGIYEFSIAPFDADYLKISWKLFFKNMAVSNSH